MKKIIIFLTMSYQLAFANDVGSEIPPITDANILKLQELLIKEFNFISLESTKDKEYLASMLNIMRLRECGIKLMEKTSEEEKKVLQKSFEETSKKLLVSNSNEVKKLKDEQAMRVQLSPEFAQEMMKFMGESGKASVEKVCPFPLDIKANSMKEAQDNLNKYVTQKDKIKKMKSKLHPAIALLVDQVEKETLRFHDVEKNILKNPKDESKMISNILRYNFLEDLFDPENLYDNFVMNDVLVNRIIKLQKGDDNQITPPDVSADEAFVLLFTYYQRSMEYYSMMTLFNLDSNCINSMYKIFNDRCSKNELYQQQLSKYSGILLCVDDNILSVPKECTYSKTFQTNSGL